MPRITIHRPDGSTESVIHFTSSTDAKIAVATLRAKIKAAGAAAKGWTVRLRTFR